MDELMLAKGQSPEILMRGMTDARIRLGRFGAGLPTNAAQSFLLDHARAREAVWSVIDALHVAGELARLELPCLLIESQVDNRADYLRRPDLGRKLSCDGHSKLAAHAGRYDLAIVVADGLSATAVNINAPAVVEAVAASSRENGWIVAPVSVVRNARVAIGDSIARALGARAVVVLIGERPGLSACDSLGAYITLDPSEATPDSKRNCISNIRDRGLEPKHASLQIVSLLEEIFRKRVSGVSLAKAMVVE